MSSALAPTRTRRLRAASLRSRRPSAPLDVRRRGLPRRPQDLPTWAAALAVLALTCVGAAIRIAVPRGLWLDEAISAHQAHLGLGALIQNLAQTDRHPPLHHLALWATVRLFGDSDMALRAPSIVAGTLVVPALYLLGRELYDRRTGVVAALLATVAPILVWYAQEARMYAFVTLFAVLTVLGCVRALRHDRVGDWALYALAGSALLWSHWFAGLIVLGAEIVLVVAAVRRRQVGPRLVVATLLLAAQLVPLGILAADQVHATGAGGGYAGAADAGSGVSFYTVTSNASWLLGGFHANAVTEVLSAIWPLGMLLSLLALGRRAQPRTLALTACIAGPILALLLLGLFAPGVFEVRYFLAAAPFAVLLIARVAVAWSASPWRRALLVGGVLAVLAVALADQQLNPSNPRRYDYREALAQVGHQMRPGDVLLYEPPELRYVLEHYAPDMDARPLDGALPSRREARHVIVLASFMDQQRYRAVVNRQIGALRYYRGRPVRSSMPGVTMWRFAG